MWALLLKAATWIFGGGIGQVTALINQIVGLIRKPIAVKKQENEKSVDDEFRGIEKGERPKWDA